MKELLGNAALIAPLISIFLAQFLKILIGAIPGKRLDFGRFLSSGGMPSSHSAAVASLAAACGLIYGVGGAPFATSTIFACIVVSDAAGIRRAASQQAEVLNDLVQKLAHLSDPSGREVALNTLLGHTYPQVFFGILLGVIVAFLTTSTFTGG